MPSGLATDRFGAPAAGILSFVLSLIGFGCLVAMEGWPSRLLAYASVFFVFPPIGSRATIVSVLVDALDLPRRRPLGPRPPGNSQHSGPEPRRTAHETSRAHPIHVLALTVRPDVRSSGRDPRNRTSRINPARKLPCPISPVKSRSHRSRTVPLTARGGADIAIVSVPARAVAATLAACAAKGVKGAVVFSSGFGEVGAEGRALQDEIARIARETGVRVVGCRPGYPSSVGRSHY